MTEQEWLNCRDRTRLLEYLTERASNRKFRLFGCACCWRIWHLLDDQCRRAVIVAEEYADEQTGEDKVEAVRREVTESCTTNALTPGSSAKLSWAYGAARLVLFETPFWKPNQAEQWAEGAARSAAEAAWRDRGEDGPALEERQQLELLRDVFENPYQPGWAEDEWITSSVVALAEQMYQSRDFSGMPILADALQDAGCDNADILDHCRRKGLHVKGCWVVDLLTGRK